MSTEAWPDGKLGRPRLVDAVSLGWCSRQDADVGASGLCGEFSLLGVDVAFRSRWRITGEIGFGGTVATTTGDSTIGVAKASGGVYWAGRVMVGWDITRLYFTRIGFQLKEALALGSLATGPQFVADMGTRALGHLEVGFRFYVGGDGLVSRMGSNTSSSEAFAFGIMLFTRVFVP